MASRDPREETHDDPAFSRLVRGEIERLSRPGPARSTWRLAAAALAGLATCGGIVWFVASREPPPPPLPVAALREALAAERYDEAASLLAAGGAHPAAPRWRAVVAALAAESRARRDGRWEAGLDALAGLLEAAGREPWVAAESARRRERLEAESRAAAALAAARDRIAAADMPGATAILMEVPAESVYRSEAEILLAALGLAARTAPPPAAGGEGAPPADAAPPDPSGADAAGAQRRALAAYRAGDAEGALALLAPDAALAARVRACRDAYERAIREMTGGQFVSAAISFREVIAREPEPDNWFRAHAAAGLEEIRAATRDLARSWIEDAAAALEAGRHAEAGRLVQDALALDPEDPAAAALRADLRDAAERLYEESYVLCEIDPARARERLALLMALLPDGDPLRAKAAAAMRAASNGRPGPD